MKNKQANCEGIWANRVSFGIWSAIIEIELMQKYMMKQSLFKVNQLSVNKTPVLFMVVAQFE
ncbi:MAG: hypothetical protein O6852_07885 [Gammaproteobacteria bacterium]|nr:hypothetical protein [Gammaproteobacteria bacterium]